MRVECVVPLAGGCPCRLEAWEWVRERLPFPYRVGSCDGVWVKASAVTPALVASRAEIVAVLDADCWCPGLPDAVRAVQAGAAWSMPHRGVHRLSESASAALREGAAWDSLPLEQPAYLGIEGGGCVVARRETLLDIPLDPRFVGWGQEDESFGRALRTLLGPPVRIKQPLIHLYHPPQERMSRRRGSKEGWRLRKRYVHADGDPPAMRALLEEIHADPPHQPRMHADSALVGND